MIKIKPIKFEKIWGYELYLYSSLPGRETVDENNKKPTEGPLVKIVRANEKLSVQVHPDDQKAKELEGQKNGKNESWYVLDTFKPHPQIVTGLKEYDAQKIRQMIAQHKFEENLVLSPVKVGDFINVPAGMVHGLGAGVEVLEVQQPSDTTYRFYDYNRLENGKPRPLHLEKALLCQKKVSYTIKPVSEKPLTFINEVCKQIFLKEPYVLQADAIVVDFANQCGYVGKKGEKVEFKHYAVIVPDHWKHPS